MIEPGPGQDSQGLTHVVVASRGPAGEAVCESRVEASQLMASEHASVRRLSRQRRRSGRRRRHLQAARRAARQASRHAAQQLAREQTAVREQRQQALDDSGRKLEAARACSSRQQTQLELLTLDLQTAREAQLQLEAEVARLNGVCVEFEQALQEATSSRGWRFAHRLSTTRAAAGRTLWSVLRRCYHSLPLPRSWRWSLRATFFETFALLLKGKPSYHSYEQARRLQARLTANRDTSLPPRDSELSDYVFFGVIDWHLRFQRPQHLAEGLAARGHRVFYISPNFIDAPEPGAAIEVLDDGGRLLSVRLQVMGSPVIYSERGTEGQREQLRASLAGVLHDVSPGGIVAVLHHPFWTELADTLPNRRLVYDCLDHHGGFSNTSAAMIEAEGRLIAQADLVVTTAHWLRERLSGEAENLVLVPNACDYEVFSQRPADVFEDAAGRPVIGYIGAIAEWFDVELIAAVARALPHCLVLLVGADTCGARSRLQGLPNVRFEGEVPYQRLTHYLYGMDVCTIPFRVIPLTLATNPVKVFEYLAAGRAVVSTALPEVALLGDVAATVAEDHASFVRGVAEALEQRGGSEAVAARREFAAANTWAQRVQAFDEHLAATPRARVSVVIITYNGLDLTRRCLESILHHTDGCELELIFVDNASHDDTPGFLADFCRGRDDAVALLNDDNRGFAAAVNQGLERARHESLVVMNNDTVVAPGWLSAMVRHVQRDPSIGIIGPMTNNIGNEARIEMSYDDPEQMHGEVQAQLMARQGRRFELSVTAFFCVLIPRATYEAVGGLDERFGRGFFEDDDYCCRVREAGLKVVCAEDAFVHHELSASFGKLPTLEKQRLFEENRKKYEAKWGPWTPHEYR